MATFEEAKKAFSLGKTARRKGWENEDCYLCKSQRTNLFVAYCTRRHFSTPLDDRDRSAKDWVIE